MGIIQKIEVDISHGGSAIEFFLHECLTGSRVGSSRVEREILIIIKLIPNFLFGFGFWFVVVQMSLNLETLDRSQGVPNYPMKHCLNKWQKY